MAAQFLISCYTEWSEESDANNLDKGTLKYLWLGAELADYFNILNMSLGTKANKGAGALREGELYRWITSLSQDLLVQVLARIAETQGLVDKDLDLLNDRIRFCASVAINEMYRRSEYRYCLENLPPLINFLEKHLAPLAARCDDLKRAGKASAAEARKKSQMRTRLERYKLEYEDTLSYLYFLRAKCARQSQSFREAIDDALRSTEYLLSGALALTAPCGDGSLREDAAVAGLVAHYRLCRVGVTDLARSWTYLAWGRIDAAALVERRARLLINEKDGLNYHLAKSIGGIIKRIKAGKADKEHLDEAVELLRSSYEYFSSFPFPRYAVRCLFELGLAYVLRGELGEAAKLLLSVSIRTGAGKEGALRRLLDAPRWQVQTHLLLSHIARKDKEGNAVALLHGGGWFVRRALKRREDLLQLAIEEAERALAVAEKHRLRIGELEAQIYLGEAHLSLADEINQAPRRRKEDDGSSAPYVQYEMARVAFKRAARMCAPPGSIAAPPGELFARQQAGGEGNIAQQALCKLYLAKIEITLKSDKAEEKARAHLEDYEALLPIEHGWIKELEAKVRKQLDDLQNRFLVIPFDDDHTYEQVEANYYVALADKLRTGERRISEVARRMKVSRDTIYNIMKRADAALERAEAADTKRQRIDSDE
jgi:hypothetical protein